jgi:hypothetical protein
MELFTAAAARTSNLKYCEAAFGKTPVALPTYWHKL